MARPYLLDTNILSHLVRLPQGAVAERIADKGEANVLTGVIVACELRLGAAKRGSRRLTRQVEAVLGALTIRPLESNIERVYASIRVALEKREEGDAIGGHDILIAAHARHRRDPRDRQRGRVQACTRAEGRELVAVRRCRRRAGSVNPRK
ncbi:MAG TPA: PIN domain-containing protein [Vicinamibacterales bacterium]|nr:PIN domain-containing protein [Vicinamibacterales bacterium]